MEPLKNLTLEKLKENYSKLCNWVIKRENAKTPAGQKEFNAGLARIEEYETELKARGVESTEMHALYLNSFDIVEEAKNKEYH